MDASIFVRQPNTTEYKNLGVKAFSVLPRTEEFFSMDSGKKFYQVVGIHHRVDQDSVIEIYAVETAPPWLAKKGRAIGFGA
ncbi:MAG: hypothetical protein WA874_12085 [Chryseosolibacter sp.]